MDKKQRHNLLLIFAASILLIGVIVQLYLMFTAEQNQDNNDPGQSITQPR